MPTRPLTTATAMELAADPTSGPRIAALAMREAATVRAAVDVAAAEPPDTVEKLVAAAAALGTAVEPLARLSASVG